MQIKSATSATTPVRRPLQPRGFSADRLTRPALQNKDRTGFERAVACLDHSPNGSIVYRHTKAIAEGLNIPVKVIHVVQGSDPQSGPSDPIKWQLQCREARDHLRQILKEEHDMLSEQDQLLLNGFVGEELAHWACENSGSLMAVTTRCNRIGRSVRHFGAANYIGSTAQKLLESSAASMLFIPPDMRDTGMVSYRRVIVPLDGSCRAESILPIAMRIARHHGAEVILAHVVPKPEIVEARASAEEASLLVDRMRQFNEQNVREYLDGLKERLQDESIVIETMVSADGDPREQLVDIAKAQMADLIVMSARGNSKVTNISYGNVVRHIATHSSIPLLMIRQQGPNSRDPGKLFDGNRGPRMFWEPAH